MYEIKLKLKKENVERLNKIKKAAQDAKAAVKPAYDAACKIAAKAEAPCKKAIEAVKGKPCSAIAKDVAEKVSRPVIEFVNEANEGIDAICERDPAVKSRAEAALLYSGFHAIMAYRVANKLYKKEHYTSARFVSQSARFLTGIEIHPGATIGKGLFIDHGSGVVIGETTIIGDNCTLYQGVTLGGTGKDTGKRHPTLGDNVMVGAGAKVLGNFTVGDGAKIAAGAVVLGPVPENCTAVGIPAHVVRRAGKKVDPIDLDQVHIPDPVSQELCNMSRRMLELEKKVVALENEKEDSVNE